MKFKKFQSYLNDKKVGLALLINTSLNNKDPNFFYFTQFDVEYGCLTVTPNTATLFEPEMEMERARNESRIRNIINIKDRKFLGLLKERFKNIRCIGINKEAVTLNGYNMLRKHFKKARFVDISKICNELRLVKTNTEIKHLKKACAITDKILQKCIYQFDFRTELEVANFLEDEVRSKGLEKAFNPIVASGNNSSMPHYSQRENKLNKGFCIIDFGLKVEGYCSDITRTIYFGNPSQKEKELYYLLLKAQRNAIKDSVANKIAYSIDKALRKELGKYKKNIIHGLGHGLGINVHELPIISSKSREIIRNGMVFTIEPGIYFKKKFGIRIEDDLLISKDKAEVLTKTDKELITV